MAEPLRPLHSVPEADEDAVSPVSSRRSHIYPRSPSSANPFSPSMFHRGGYHRMDSDGAQEMVDLEEPPARASPDPPGSALDGLGITVQPGAHRRVSSASSISRRPVGGSRSSLEARSSHHGLLETPDPSTPPASARSPWDKPPPLEDRISAHDLSVGPEPLKNNAAYISGTPASDPSSGRFIDHGTPGFLNPNEEFDDNSYDDRSFYQKFSEPPSYCWSKRDIHTKRTSWLSITIFVLSVYSTAMSGIWLVVAIIQPRWGHGISSSRGLLPSTGTVLAALVSKSIEMSFVTVFISIIGQVLTRRSFVRKSRGMTLAEMTMRNWVIQPGSLITHFETIPYAGLTILGALSLTATLAAIFYTTASDAMVAPKLKYGHWENKELSGFIMSSYGNSEYIKETCPALFDVEVDEHSEESCMNVMLSGQSYRNLYSFLSTWTMINENGTSTIDDIGRRPPGTTLLHDNTTMTASWIETEHSNVTARFEETGRIINNVTMAMPHPGVYAAATSRINGILQPDDLAGVGEYAIRAGVVSPSLNVMCVDMTAEELAPLVYTEWQHSQNNDTVVDGQLTGWDGWEGEVPMPTYKDGKDNYLNRTVVDDIFRWGLKYERRPPVFQLYPADYNLVTNSTVYLSDSMYLLGKDFASKNYTLCEMRSWVSPNCSTQFNISGITGANMGAHCEDPKDRNSYLRSFEPDQSWSEPSTDWRYLAGQWGLSMDLNGGVYNNNASNARILTQLALKTPELPSYLPSMAEALAVYASSTVVISSIDTPFVHWWEYEKPGNILGDGGAMVKFNASVITQEYTSGHVNDWQNIFYIVLVLVFAINVFCLVYFVARSGLVTDFTEPQNLFALAVNSPPSAQLKGSCGAGPEQRDLVVPWRVAWAPSANHYFFEEANEKPWRGKYATQGVSTARDYGAASGSSYKRLSTSRIWL